MAMSKQFYHPVTELNHAMWATAHAWTCALSDLQSEIPEVQALAVLTHQWITGISGRREAINHLLFAGICRNKIRWVYGRNQEEREWATEQALLAGTSSIVLTWLGELSPRTEQRLKMASKVSQTHSFVFNPALSLTPLH